jgi:hypothetical protein
VRNAVRRAVDVGRRHGLHAARQQAQALVLAHLLAGLEHHLQADADAQERPAALRMPAHDVVEPARAQFGHAVAESADAGQHQAVGLACLGRRLVDDADRGAAVFQRPQHVQQVADAVVDDGDGPAHGAAPCGCRARQRWRAA